MAKFIDVTILVTKRTGSTSQSCFWTFIQMSSPGKYKKTDLRVTTVSTRRHALTSVRFDVLFCGKLFRYKSITSSVDVKIM